MDEDDESTAVLDIGDINVKAGFKSYLRDVIPTVIGNQLTNEQSNSILSRLLLKPQQVDQEIPQQRGYQRNRTFFLISLLIS